MALIADAASPRKVLNVNNSSKIQALERAVRAALDSGDMGLADRLSAQALRKGEGNIQAIELRASVLSIASRHSEAIELLRLLNSTADLSEQGQVQLMRSLAVCGDDAGAVSVGDNLLKNRPRDFLLHLLRAECLEKINDHEAALLAYFRAVHEAQAQGRWLSDATTSPVLRERVKRAMTLIDAGRGELFYRLLEPHVHASGREALTRVMKGLEVYLGLDKTRAPAPGQRPTFLWLPDLPATPVFDREQFGWYASLETAAGEIVEELRQVMERAEGVEPFLELDGRADSDRYLGGEPVTRAWDAYFFYRHGRRYDAHHLACPRTSAAMNGVPLTRIDAHAPEVLFSILAPGTHIKPHHGVSNTRVVTHLALLVPEGDCRLVVGGQSCSWQAGRCLTFDDTFIHEAWNRTLHTRVVMILDTWHPDLRSEEQQALRGLVEGIGLFNERAGVSR